MTDDLDTLRTETAAALAASTDLRAWDAVRVGALGKQGRLTGMLKELGKVSHDVRRERGARLNVLKDELTAMVEARRAELDAEVLKMFNASTRTYGSPRIHADLLEAGWMLSVNTVADSRHRQGLQGRKPKHSSGLTRQDRKAPKFPDLLKRDFTAPGPNVKWCGDITEIPTDEGKLYLATVLDLFSRRLLACPRRDQDRCSGPRRTRQDRGGRLPQ